jgi:tripartite-type tricarboxylate transporter receptor subunit TctC
MINLTEPGAPLMSTPSFLLVGLLSLAALLPLPLQAQPYPGKPIRLIAPFPPAGTVDFLARLISEIVSPRVGQQIVVENRPGAGGNLGTDLVAKAAPDGYTLGLVASGNLVINPFLYRSMPFDPMSDLMPVFNIGDAPQLLVVTGALPAQNLREFLAYAKTRAGPLHYASAGVGTTTHLAMDHFARLAGIELQHVPYRGVGQALPDLLAGRVQAISVGLGPVRAQLESGALRALVAAAPKRLAALPQAPTSAEAGVPGYEMTTWFGVVAPRGTSPTVVSDLNRHLQNMLDDPKTQQRLLESGIEPAGGDAQSFGSLIRSDYRKWEPVVKASGARLE